MKSCVAKDSLAIHADVTLEKHTVFSFLFIFSALSNLRILKIVSSYQPALHKSNTEDRIVLIEQFQNFNIFFFVPANGK